MHTFMSFTIAVSLYHILRVFAHSTEQISARCHNFQGRQMNTFFISTQRQTFSVQDYFRLIEKAILDNYPRLL